MSLYAAAYYRTLRKDRKYLPTWSRLSPKHKDVIIKHAAQLEERNCDIAGAIMTDLNTEKGLPPGARL